MRTSLNEIYEIEQHILEARAPEDGLVFEARMLTNPKLKLNVYLQKKIHLLTKIFYREQIKAEIGQIHHKVFSDHDKKEFQKKIFQLFNP